MGRRRAIWNPTQFLVRRSCPRPGHLAQVAGVSLLGVNDHKEHDGMDTKQQQLSTFEEDCLKKKPAPWTHVDLPQCEALAPELVEGELPLIEVFGWEDGERLPSALRNSLFFNKGGRNKLFNNAWHRKLYREGVRLCVAEHLTALAELCYRRNATDAQTLGVLADWLLLHRINVGFSGVPPLMEEGLYRLIKFRQSEASRQRALRARRKAKAKSKPLQMPIEGKKEPQPLQPPLKLGDRVLAAFPADRPVKAKEITYLLGIDRRALAQVLKAAEKNGSIQKIARGVYQKLVVQQGRAA
jgi:hypothetical protein